MLDEKLRTLNYSQSSVGMCLYYQTTYTIILVGIYVDDWLVTSNNVKLVDEFFEQMKAFDVKHLGEAEKFLVITIESETALLQHEPKGDDWRSRRSIWLKEW